MNKGYLSRIFILLFLLLAAGGFSVEASESDVIMYFQSDSEDQFTIIATDPVGNGYIGDLTVKVWTGRNGQDDERTEIMSYADGQYTLAVSSADHNLEKGQYFVELNGPSGLLKTDFTTLAVDGNEWVRYQYNDSGIVESMICRAVLTIKQSIENNTEEANYEDDFKSGYGYTTTYETSVTSNVEVEAEKALTGAGNARLYFPEYNYNKGVIISETFGQYDRLTDCTDRENQGNIANSKLELKTNPFSASENRVHFTPIWYPDELVYPVYSEIFDAWTPGGMLSSVSVDRFTVDGNVYDDWQVDNKRVE